MSTSDAQFVRGAIQDFCKKGVHDAMSVSDYSAGWSAGYVTGLAEPYPDLRAEVRAAAGQIRATIRNRWRLVSGAGWKRPKYFQHPRAWPR